MKPGTRVIMSAALKERMAVNSAEHVAEFGQSVGVVIGQAEGDWPEVDVRWEPHGLRYAYLPADLVEVDRAALPSQPLGGRTGEGSRERVGGLAGDVKENRQTRAPDHTVWYVSA